MAGGPQDRGWAAFNNGPDPKQIRVQTGLPRGTYCDVVNDSAARGVLGSGRGGRHRIRHGHRAGVRAVAIQRNKKA